MGSEGPERQGPVLLQLPIRLLGVGATEFAAGVSPGVHHAPGVITVARPTRSWVPTPPRAVGYRDSSYGRSLAEKGNRFASPAQHAHRRTEYCSPVRVEVRLL